MKKILLIIGEELRLKQNFLDYIFRHCKENSLEFDEIKFANKNDKNLPIFLENLTNKCEFLTIFASGESYALTAKIIATINNDLLELKCDTLVPSLAQKVEKNSFLTTIKNTQINLIKASPFENLGQILTPCEKNFQIYYIFDYDLNSIKRRIGPFLKTFDVSVNLSQFSKFLVALKVSENAFGQIDDFLNCVKSEFKSVIDDENFIRFIAQKLIASGAKITFAESCTAGLVAAKFGEISGVSEIFEGAVVTYSKNAKNAWLGVKNETLSKFGVYSNECVSEMLDGILKLSKADFAIAISGVAGPFDDGEIPAGTIFVGVGKKSGEKIIEKIHIAGDRNFVRDEAVLTAFSLLLRLESKLFFN